MNKDEMVKWSGVLIPIVLIIIGGWIQINSRISMLEVQVRNDHEMFLSQSKKVDEISENVNEIKNQLTEMRGELKLKQDRFKPDEVYVEKD